MTYLMTSRREGTVRSLAGQAALPCKELQKPGVRHAGGLLDGAYWTLIALFLSVLLMMRLLNYILHLLPVLCRDAWRNGWDSLQGLRLSACASRAQGCVFESRRVQVTVDQESLVSINFFAVCSTEFFFFFIVIIILPLNLSVKRLLVTN